jgi:hypothetical protein
MAVNISLATADGFSDKLCGNLLAWRLNPRSWDKVCPHQHDLRTGNIAVEDNTAVAAMHPPGERLAVNRAALWAGSTCAMWIDQLQRATGAFSLLADLLGQLVPRSVVDGIGEHPARQSFDVQILHRDVRETVNQ